MRILYIFLLFIFAISCKKDAMIPVGTGNQYVLSTQAPSAITQTSVVINASLEGGVGGPAISARGAVLGHSPHPTIADPGMNGTGGIGPFTVTFNSLLIGKKYYVRAFAVINRTTVLYGNEFEFTTEGVKLAEIASGGLSSLTRNSAVFSGNITWAGGGTVSARGVCWSTTSTPTLSNSYTINGAGTGYFTGSLTGLMPATNYYVRAYATNEAGTAYGPLYSFKTLN